MVRAHLVDNNNTLLWRFGRDNFQESMKIANRTDHDKIDWNSFRFMVFDIPTSKGNYQERYHQLRTVTSLTLRILPFLMLF